MLAYARAQVVAGAYEKQFRFVPVILAWLVAALPFTMELRVARFSNSPSMVEPEVSSKPRGEPLAILENPFRALMQAHAVVEPPKRAAMPLDSQQRAVTSHITRKYGVSTEVVGELVRTAYAAGKEFGIDPLLVVAIMAVESSFNPIAESVAGAKGLMQIIPKYHLEKLADYGGEQAAFDPRVNILVGARIIREYLLMASGDLFTALQTYAGALGDRDAAYTHRVLNEKDLLDGLTGRPKTERGGRVAMSPGVPRPGSLVVPRVEAPEPLPGPVLLTPAQPATPAAAPLPSPAASLPQPPALPSPATPKAVPALPASIRPLEEARPAPAHTPPTVPSAHGVPASPPAVTMAPAGATAPQAPL
jgi:hypothetical protein